jgi:hypothetical protein
MKKGLIHLLLILFVVGACYDDPSEEIEEKRKESMDKKNEGDTTSSPSTATGPLALYFPPVGDSWATFSPDSLGWDNTKLADLLLFVSSQNTYGFLISYKGRIVVEKYWNGWGNNTKYPIASASKSIIALLTGIVQQEGRLKIDDPTSKYLGPAWSLLPIAKENLITVKHHLSMTTGLDENEVCITSDCLQFTSPDT